jgi:PAS domain S-box-containing protein
MSPSIKAKINSGLIIFIFFGLAAVLVGLYYQPVDLLQFMPWLLWTKYFIFLLGFPVGILVTKVMLLKRTWDYVYLNLGLWAFLLFLVFPKIHFWLMALNHQPLPLELDRLLETTGFTIFALLFLTTTFTSANVIGTRHYPLGVVLGHVLGFFVVSSLMLISLFLYEPLLQIWEQTQFGFLVITVVQFLVFLLAGIKYFNLYWRKQTRPYFWFTLVAVFSILASVGFAGEKLGFAGFFQIDLYLKFFGLFSLLLALLNEHYRFLESEAVLRTSLEKSLRETEQQLQSQNDLINEIQVGVFVLDAEGQISFANQSWCRMLGLEEKKIIGVSFKKFLTEAGVEKFEIEQQKWREQVDSQFEIELVTKNIPRFPVLIIGSGFHHRKHGFYGSRHVVVPMARWKEIEQDLKGRSENLEQIIKQRTAALNKKSEELEFSKNYYETLISGMLDIMLVIDNLGNCTFINAYGSRLLGYSAEELSGKNLPDFFKDFRKLPQNYGSAMSLELHDHELEVKTKSGQTIVCSWNVHLLPELNRQPMGVMFVGRDITEQKRLESQLKDQTRNLEFLVGQRTAELNLKVNQLNKIIQVGEDIVLNLNLNVILENICKATKTLGWKIVIIALREFDSRAIQIAAATGLSEKKFKEISENSKFDFKEILNYMRDEYLISHSYLLDHSLGIFDFDRARLKMPQIARHSDHWQAGDSFLVPIKIKTQIHGFIVVKDPESGTKPGVEQATALEIFANKAAVVIENARLYSEAKKQALEMKKLSTLKTEFLANMSHELRTPLNSIITLGQILLKELPGPLTREQARQVQIIEKNGQNLLHLINGLLDLSKIEAGKMEPHYSCFSLIELVQHNVETIRPLCEKKGLKLELVIDKNLPQYIFSDSEKVGQVLTNLLGNAVKFTEKGKIKVTVAVRDEGRKLRLVIEDTGIGMSPTDQERIFQEFTQLESAQSVSPGRGTGLGLSISRKLIELLDGTISVKSRIDHGTGFTILLPLKGVGKESVVAETNPPAGKVRLNISESDSDDCVQIEELPGTPPPATQSPESEAEKTAQPIAAKANQTQRHILLVDDNDDNRYAISYYFSEKGYRFSFAANGKEGIDVAIHENPDIILMDVMMPVMDGYEATRNLKQRAQFKNTPIIAMTARAMNYDREKAIQSGYDDYLAKPFTLDAVSEKIEFWLKKSGK